MTQTRQTLYRLPKEAVIAGVASGLARYFSMDVTLMRLIFVGALLVTHGAALVAYIVLAIVMPTPEKSSSQGTVEEKVEHLAEEVKRSGRLQSWSNYAGIALIVFGVWMLVAQFVPELARIQWSVIWPGLVIIVGVLIITRSKHYE